MEIEQRVYELVKRIPRGKVSTYGEIARALGNKKLARVVGQILKRNQDPEKIPCYRVVRSDGRIGGYSLGIWRKIKLLKKDGIKIENGRIKEFEKFFYKFK